MTTSGYAGSVEKRTDQLGTLHGYRRITYNGPMNTITLDQARAAKPRVHELLRDVPQLAGVGITRVGEGYAVKVNLSAASEDGIDLPTEVDGVPIRIEIVGQVRKRDSL